MKELFPIVHEDAELLVIDKPAGLVCHPTKGDEYSSLISRVRLYLGDDCTAHLVNRLDRETGGIVVVAKSDESAKELRRIWENRKVQKVYRAIVHGMPPSNEGVVDAPLGNDERSPVAIKDCVRSDGSEARTEYRVLGSVERAEGRFSEVELRPVTGRKHQLRIHLAHLGCPIVGDKIYGEDETAYLDFVNDRLTEKGKKALIFPNQALHAVTASFEWRDEKWEFVANVSEFFTSFMDGREFRPVCWPEKPR